MGDLQKKLLLGTSNPGKRAELQALLDGLPLQLLSQEELGDALEVAETGSSYVENARLKAATLANHFGLWTLADDTGLEVDVLDGAPGLHSARLLGPGASDSQRRERLLDLVSGKPRPWSARFRCTAALAGPDGEIIVADGVCEGEIVPEERGAHGFGYDAIFKVAGTDKTMAQLSFAEKNRRSHRARAINALLPEIKNRLAISD